MAPRGTSQALLRAALRTQPDERLLALGREGGGAAGEEIVRRYRQPLVRFAASIVPAQRAEDVVHDALGRALTAIERGEEVERLRPWLFAIVRNAALNDLRDQPPPHEQIDESYDGVEQPPQAQERRARLRELVSAVQGLPPAQREAIVRRELEGRSHEEIAAGLGVSPGSARQLIFRAREALRQGLGSLLPMPLLRHLLESGDGGIATAGAVAGGGAVATKTAVALIAAGALVGGGLVARDAARDHGGGGPAAAEAAIVPSPLAASGGTAAAGLAAAPGPPTGTAGNRGHGDGRAGDRGGSAGNERASAPAGSLAPGSPRGESPGGPGSGSAGEDGGGHSPHDTRHGDDGSGRSPQGGSGSDRGSESGGGHGSGRDESSSDDSGSIGTSGGTDDGGQSGSGEPTSESSSGSGGSGDGGASGSGEETPSSSGPGPGEEPAVSEPEPPPPLEGTTSDDPRDSGPAEGS